MTEKTSPPAAKRRFPTPYVMIWALLASLSLAYLALLAMQPRLVAQYFGASPATGIPRSNDGQLTITDAVADIASLREAVGQVQGDLDNLKAEVSEQAERERDVTARLAALEVNPGDPTRFADTAAAPAMARALADKGAERVSSKETPKAAIVPKTINQKTPTLVAQAASRSERIAALSAGSAALPAKAAASGGAKKTIAAPAAAPEPEPTLETGSVAAGAPPPVAFGPAVVTPAGKALGLRIATGPSVDSLRLSWSLLSGRHEENLAALEPRYITGSDASGLTYELIVGPIGSAADAKRICKELTQKGTSCQLGDFVGDAL
jgi:hypothetical protein